MSVSEVSIDGLGTPINPQGQALSIKAVLQGSAVLVAPGLYLTAAHVFYGPTSQGNVVYTFSPGTFFVNPNMINNSKSVPANRTVSGSNQVTNFNNVSNYKPSATIATPVGTDLAAFSANSAGTSTGVAMFLAPSVTNFNKFFSSVNFNGYPAIDPTDANNGNVVRTPDAKTSGTIQAVDQSFGTFNGVGTFLSSGDSQPGDSGAGVWATAKGTNTNYVLGTVLGDNATTHEAITNYLTAKEYDAIYSNYKLPSGASYGPPNLIVGAEKGNDDIKRTAYPENVVDSGNTNLIQIGSGGGLVNPEVGKNNVVFLPGASGDTDPGTTVVISPSNTTIVGGGPDDKLVFLADRLWSRQQGAPTASSVSDESSTIQVTGGLGNPNVQSVTNLSPLTGDSTGYYFMNTNANYTTANENSTNPVDWLTGNYAYDLRFYMEANNDLIIDAEAPNLSTGSDLWQSVLTIKDFHQGDFGLTFTTSDNLALPSGWDASDGALISSPVQQHSIIDDSTISWNGLVSVTPAALSSATLTSDLHKLMS